MALPRRILLAYHRFPPIAYDLAAAFRRMGIETRLFITDEQEHVFYKQVIKRVNKLARNLRLVPKGTDLFRNHPLNRLNRFSSEFHKACDEFQPDFLLFVHGQPFGNEVLVRQDVPKVAWWIEPNSDPAELRRFAEPFEVYATFSSDSLAVLEREGIRSEYLCHAVDPARFHPIPGAAQEQDAAFVGNWSPWREEVIRRVLSVTDRLALYGPNWKRKSNLGRAVLSRIHKGNEIVGAELNALFNASRVVLNAQRMPENSGLNMRFFEVPASGACYLTDPVPEIARHFEAGVHLEVFDGLDDLPGKLAALLQDEPRRQAMARAGYHRVLERHTYDLMARHFTDLYDRLLTERSADKQSRNA